MQEKSEIQEGTKEERRLGQLSEKQEDEVANLKKLLQEESEKAEQYLTRLKYALADLENYRKRTEQEMKEVKEQTTKKIIHSLLSVFDELDLALAASANSTDENLRNGIGMIYRKLQETLASEGLSKIESVGKQFDPQLHEAVERVQGDSADNGMIVDEIRSGYLFKGRVLRPSMVTVAYLKIVNDKKGD